MSAAVQHIKTVAVGDGAVGKTTLLISFTSDTFSDEYVPTIFDNYSCLLSVDGKTINLGLWDTAGQEDYDRLRPLSYPQTDVFMVMYSVISPSSLQNVLSKWYPEVTHHAPNVPVVLVGTKIDLLGDQQVIDRLAERSLRPVTFAEADSVAKSIHAAAHIQVSSFTRTNVREAFFAAVRAVIAPKKPVKKVKKCRLL